MTRVRFFINDYFLKLRNLQFENLPKTVAEFEAMPVIKLSTAPIDWTLQTYLRLKEAGYSDLELTNEVPTNGIVIAHADAFYDEQLDDQRKIYKVAIQGDRMQAVQAHVHVVQNPTDHKIKKHLAHFIPFWPQYNLVKRDANRAVMKVSYCGWQRWQAWPLQAPHFAETMSGLGMELDYKFEDRKAEWHDYSQADVILAARSFDGNPYVNKPATKLYNAWRAEVPAILGPESAYQALRRDDLDYLEISSEAEAVEAIKQLKEDSQLYSRMVENGRQRATEFTTESIVQKWAAFIANVRGERKW